MRHRVSLFALALAAGGLGGSAVVSAASLEDEVAGMVKTDPTIAAQQGQVDASSAAVDVARAGYFPQLHVTANEGPEHFDTATQRLSDNGQPLTAPGNGAGATLTQRVFDGGQTSSAVRAAHDTVSVEESNLGITQENRTLEAVNAYLNVLEWRDYLAEAQRFQQRMQDLEDQIDKRVKGGGGDQTDSLTAFNNEKFAEGKVVYAQGTLNNAIVSYIQVFGHPPQMPTMRLPAPAEDVVPANLDDAISAANQGNPTVEAARRSVSLANDLQAQAEAGYYPDVDLFGKIDYGNNRDGNVGVSRDWEALVEVNWDLFSGFRTQAQSAQAAQELARSQSLSEAATRKAAQDVRMAYVDATTSKRTYAISQDRLDTLKKLSDARIAQQKTSKTGSLNDVMAADYTYYVQSLDVITFKYAVTTADYKMLYALGKLVPGNLDRSPNGSGPAATAK